MRVALIGYGKMGKVIESILLERGHQVTLKITRENSNYTSEELKSSDVAIEFSVPEAAAGNIRKCFEAHVPVVVGTTAWYAHFDDLTKECKRKNGALFYASNFSLGVNIFFEVNKKLAAIMNQFPGYNVDIDEIHHTQKLDAPSGTAITTAEVILKELDRKNNWSLNSENSPSDLKITAQRIPDVPGTHIVKYESDIDVLTFEHQAKSRKGFALGAVLAAEFLHGKKGVFGMNDLLNF
ncbi:MAG: 4-hydroxy-tetrahydrodipicolinate reductase [Flavobacteriales bacterium]|nr:4-hydroxy-tetrahydrodipicolinate reductase [Flavobacteriales bacterium]